MLRLKFESIAPGRAFHAALVGPESVRGGRNFHSHDFPEVMVVVQGTGVHRVNGTELPMRAGLATLVRPADVHAVGLAGGGGLYFVNVAIAPAVWSEMAVALGVRDRWQEGLPPTANLLGEEWPRLEQAAMRIVREFHEDEGRLALARFLGLLLPALVGGAAQVSDLGSGPPWLVLATAAMAADDNLAGGLPRFVELAGVSAAHLSRTMRSVHGVTPSDFVNDLRLRRAALFLASTRSDVQEIAAMCGLDNVPYFYRLFRRRYGCTPLAYRRREAAGLFCTN